ncbi:MAG: glycosyltransferase [Tepidisphaeraceae bacterium]|jgi:glycosyltransferase involved in cell wall biosynthesis
MSAVPTIPDSAPFPTSGGKLLRVMHVVLSLDVGGLERVVLSLVSRAASLGQIPTVLCIERRGDLADECEKLGAPVYCVGKRPGLRPGIARPIADLMRQLRPDVVHTHQIAALLYAGRAARRAGIANVVHTEHGKNYAGRFRTRMLGRWAGRYAKRFFCVSSDIAAEVAEWRVVGSKKLTVVRNGIDMDDIDSATAAQTVRADMGIPLGAAVIGTVGRLSDIKRQDVLIRALARLRRQQADIHLLLVGDGPRRGDLVKLAWKLGLTDAVHFAGYQNQPQKYLAAMDVFALSSASEGMPLSVLEAWAARKPVVAFHVGGLPEIVEQRRSGILVPAGHETELTAAILEVISNPKFASELAAEGRRRVENEFSLTRTAQRYDDEYRALGAKSG